MQHNSAIKQYRSVNTHSNIDEASPHQLISMLINGALSRLATAKGCIERQDHAGKGVNLSKSIDIIIGLQCSLDMDAGGEISSNLNALYDYMTKRLLDAGVNNDASIVDEVSGLLREIKTGWDSIPKEFHYMTAPQKAAAEVSE